MEKLLYEEPIASFVYQGEKRKFVAGPDDPDW